MLQQNTALDDQSDQWWNKTGLACATKRLKIFTPKHLNPTHRIKKKVNTLFGTTSGINACNRIINFSSCNVQESRQDIYSKVLKSNLQNTCTYLTIKYKSETIEATKYRFRTNSWCGEKSVDASVILGDGVELIDRHGFLFLYICAGVYDRCKIWCFRQYSNKNNAWINH